MAAVKDKILDVASELFYRNGYNLTGINQIISEADVAIGSLYKHYPSKSDLLAAYLIRCNKHYFGAMQEQVAKTKLPKRQVLAVFDFHVYYQEMTGFSGCNFIKINAEVSRSETKVLDIVKKHKDQLYNFIKAIISTDKTVAPAKVKVISDMVYLLLEGALVDSTIQKDVQYLHDAKKVIKNML